MGNVCGDISDVMVQNPDPNADPNFILFTEKSPVRKTSEVKILSYNIFIRPPPVRTGHDDYKDERLAEFSKLLHKYDIVCLQELFLLLSFRRRKLIKAARKAGLSYSSGCPRHDTMSTLICDGGLLTMSRHPILATKFKAYPRGLGPDYFVQKGVLYTKILIHDTVLHLFSTHAQAAYTSEAKYFITLMNQWRVFRKFMTETLKKNDYKKEDMVIALGDFNIDGRNPIIYEMKELEKIYPTIREYPNLVKQETFHEYDALVSILSGDNKDGLEEMLFQQHGEHPTTYGDFYVDEKNRIMPKEHELTYEGGQSSSRRLDYIFKITPNMEETNRQDPENQEAEEVKPSLTVKEGGAKVKKFLIDGKPFTQLSDHYAVQVTLDFKGEMNRVLMSGSTLTESPEMSEKEAEELERAQEEMERVSFESDRQSEIVEKIGESEGVKVGF